MYKVITCLVLTALTLDVGLCYTTNSTSRRARIYGGHFANVAEFPYHVLVYVNNDYTCGGALISDKHVLTAAHCLNKFRNAPKYYVLTVRAGTNVLNRGDVRKVSLAQTHRKYTHENGRPYNDIALLTLARPFVQDYKIRSIRMATRPYKAKEYATVSGFGQVNWTGAMSFRMKKFTSQLMDLTECNYYVYNKIRWGDLCVSKKYGTGVCYGDSGSPLVSNGELIGIVSWGIACAEGLPDIFISVYDYKSEILSMINYSNNVFRN